MPSLSLRPTAHAGPRTAGVVNHHGKRKTGLEKREPTLNHIDSYDSAYERYETEFDPQRTDRRARRGRKPRKKHTPKKPIQQVVSEIADAAGLEGGFNPTYTPARYEEGWLLNSLEALYDQQLITDVVALVKGGKEANVYRCAAGPVTGETWLAAKVYRPRMFRQLRNDRRYREGRVILTAEGRPVKETDHRLMRAIGKKTAFGVEVAHKSWLMYEYTTLQKLHEAGAAVPRPYGVSGNAILMSYLGDEQLPAPLLSEVRLERGEAWPLFEELIRNVELMLGLGLIHGDLSAYNVLYWQGEGTLIDFPQVTEARTNPDARAIFERDVRRLCEYFARYGVRRNADALASALWNRFWRVAEADVLADLSRLEEPED